MTTLSRSAALALAVAVLSPQGSFARAETAKPTPRTHTVKIEGMAFVPATLEVSVGDTVEWINEDLVPHTATAIIDGTMARFSSMLKSTNAILPSKSTAA